MKPRIVFDIDDTICKDGKKLGYANAIPIQATIDKISRIKEDIGATIVLYTARGMGSCNGDAEMARLKNEETLIRWLEEHKVLYDELIFGKPLADLYVDDKGMSLNDFLAKEFCELHGGSGAKIYRFGDIVVKQMPSIEEAEKIKEWSDQTPLNHPHILGNVYENLYMEYIDGELACDCLNGIIYEDIMADVQREAQNNLNGFETWRLLKALDAHKGRDGRIDALIDICKTKLLDYDILFHRNASVCHGDMTLSNIIYKDWELYYIDPRPDPNASSYLLDYAKLRMSLSGYEKTFGISDTDLSYWCRRFDAELYNKQLLEAVKCLELMYVLRLTKYGKDVDKIFNFARRILEELD